MYIYRDQFAYIMAITLSNRFTRFLYNMHKYLYDVIENLIVNFSIRRLTIIIKKDSENSATQPVQQIKLFVFSYRQPSVYSICKNNFFF